MRQTQIHGYSEADIVDALNESQNMQRQFARLGSRTARTKLLWIAGYATLVVAAAVVVIRPSGLAWDGGFIAWPPPLDSTIPPGDHLQSAYHLWLWSHSLTTLSHLPWLDPFQFAATGHLTYQPAGWPLALVSVPVDLLFGPIAAYNAIVLLAFPAAALATYGLARELGGSREASAVAGFAFAFAPYRLVQGASHLNAMLMFLLPLMLLLVERALRRPIRSARWSAWGAATVLVSIAASGDMHLGVFSLALVVGFVALRAGGAPPGRLRLLARPAAAAAAGTLTMGTLLYTFIIRPSVVAGGRTLEEAIYHTPRLSDFLHRNVDWPSLERYAYPGLAITVLAMVGMAFSLRRKGERFQASWLATAWVLTALLAIMPSLEGQPWLQKLYRAIPLFSFSRAPGRIFAVSVLLLALLSRPAVDAIRSRRWRTGVAALCLAAIVLDAPYGIYAYNRAWADPFANVPKGATILDLPPLFHHGASPYSFLITTSPGPRVGGYTAVRTPQVMKDQRLVLAIANAPIDPCRWRSAVDAFGIEYVAVHIDLYGSERLQYAGDGDLLAAAMRDSPAFTAAGEAGAIHVFAVHREALACPAKTTPTTLPAR